MKLREDHLLTRREAVHGSPRSRRSGGRSVYGQAIYTAVGSIAMLAAGWIRDSVRCLGHRGKCIYNVDIPLWVVITKRRA